MVVREGEIVPDAFWLGSFTFFFKIINGTTSVSMSDETDVRREISHRMLGATLKINRPNIRNYCLQHFSFDHTTENFHRNMTICFMQHLV